MAGSSGESCEVFPKNKNIMIDFEIFFFRLYKVQSNLLANKA
jgi:hypothetical protein